MYISHTRHIIGHVLRIKPKIVKCASLIQSTLHIIKDDDSTELLHICPLAPYLSFWLGLERVKECYAEWVDEILSMMGN